MVQLKKNVISCVVDGSKTTVTEFYKPISEDNLLPPLPKEEETKVISTESEESSSIKSPEESQAANMVQEEVNADGADERMLGTEDNEKLAGKRDEVKFIKGDQNGDAKIDIGGIDGKEVVPTFTGMTKEELMKYANDPFWIRLRWIFFIGFWAIWAGMLVGAILIIVDAPKCAAPQPLSWFKRGLLAKFDSYDAVSPHDLAAAKKLQASGVIYELPAGLTYSVHDPIVEEKIKTVVANYKDSDINVILDITPNYASRDSHLMKNALADPSKQSAFFWIQQQGVPNNWLRFVNGSAWTEVKPGNFVLSQFGENLFDLHMADSIVKNELESTLRHLIKLGIRGIRLKNSKFYLVTTTDIGDEGIASDQSYDLKQYNFYTHTKTTFQEGLGDLLYEYRGIVQNASNEAFLAVADDVIRPEVYRTNTSDYGVDMLIYGQFAHFLSEPNNHKLIDNLNNILNNVGNKTWLQWNFADYADNSPVNASAYNLFMALLPGVPVIPINSATSLNVTEDMFKRIKTLRLSNSYMHGEFKAFDVDGLLAYSRIKSGNPGFMVVFNPNDHTQIGNFKNLGLPDKMTVNAISENVNATNVLGANVNTDSLELSPFSTIVLTYVPIKSG